MKSWLKTGLIVFGSMFAAAPADAQVTRADSAAVILGAAQRVRAEGRVSFSNQLLDLVIQRFGDTEAGTEARRLRDLARAQPEERSGRTELLVWSTTYGLALGALVPVALGADGPEAVGVGLIAGGPLGFAAGRAMLKDRPISEGQAGTISFSTLWGAWQAYGWSYVLDVGEREYCDPVYDPQYDYCYTSGPDGDALLRTSIAGSLVGLGTGLYLSRKPIPAGAATTVNLGALWGTWFGSALAVLTESDDGDTALTYALLGGDAGLIASAIMAPKWQLSRARARLISIAGVAGGLGGLGILMIAQPESEDAIVVPLTTSVLGLVLGVGWTRNYDVAGGREEGDGDAALLQWNGRTGFQPGVPPIGLRSVETRWNGKPAARPAMYVPVFSAKF